MAACVSPVFPPTEPLLRQISPNKINVAWTPIEGVYSYILERYYEDDDEFEFFASFARYDSSAELTVNTGELYTFRLRVKLPGETIPSYSCINHIEIDPPSAVSALGRPTLTEISSSEVTVVFKPFAGNTPYDVQVYKNQNWTTIYGSKRLPEATSTFLSVSINPVWLSINPGTPYFYRIRANGVYSESTIFSTTALGAKNGFDPDSVVVKRFFPTTATYFPANEEAGESYVTEREYNTKLGGTEEFQTLVKYDIPNPFNQCEFLYAALVWEFSPVPLNYTEMNGGFIRTFANINSWDSVGMVQSGFPVPNIPSFYLSNSQVNTKGELVSNITIFLDYKIKNGPTLISYLNSWADGMSNNGFLITLNNDGSPITKGELEISSLPSLDVAIKPLEYEMVERNVLSIPTFNADCPCTSSTCNILADESVNIDYQNELNDILDVLEIAPGDLLIQVNITITGVLTLDMEPQRLTIGIADGLIADTIIDIDQVAQTVSLTYSSPYYSPQSGGWPNFNYDNVGNNNFTVYFTNIICVQSVDIAYLAIKPLNNQFCAPSPSITPTSTPTPSRTASGTPSNTPSNTPSKTPSQTPSTTTTSTLTATPSNTQTPSNTATMTPSNTPTKSITSTGTPSNSNCPTPNFTFSITPTGTVTPSITPSQTATTTRTTSSTSTRSLSSTPTNTRTSSNSATKSPTSTPTQTGTPSSTASNTMTPTPTNTITPTSSTTITRSTTTSRSSTPSRTTTQTTSASSTQTPSNSGTPTSSKTPSPTLSLSASTTITSSRTPSISLSSSRTTSSSTSPSPSASTQPPSASVPPSKSNTFSPSVSRTASSSRTVQPSTSPTETSTPSFSSSETPSITPVPTPIIVGVSQSPTTNPTPSTFVLPVESKTPTPTMSPGTVRDEVVPLPGSGGVVDVVDENGDGVAQVEFTEIDLAGTVVITNPINVGFVENDRLVVSPVFDINLFSPNGDLIQPTDSVEICFGVDSNLNEEDYCLGFIDESSNPPKWVCQDECLRKDSNQVCGETDHFTSFALLLNGGGGGCGSSNADLIFDEEWKDYVLIATVTVGILSILVIGAFLLTVTTWGQKILRGTEGDRVMQLRASFQSTATSARVEPV